MNTTITDAFWKNYQELVANKMIPYQWNVINDSASISIEKERDDEDIPTEKSNAIENLKIAAGKSQGNHYGYLFQDSDVYKWLESASNTYALYPTDELLLMINEVVKLIEEAQDEDGYLNTYYQIQAPLLKYKRLFESHELYCAGHLIEAAIAYYKATKSDKLIKVSERFIKNIKENFGNEEGKIKGAGGHPEIEYALVKLYNLTNNKEFYDLSKWFLEVRGLDPLFLENQRVATENEKKVSGTPPTMNPEYYQYHKPIFEQEKAEGHAVRLVYMAAAMAEVAAIHDDKRMFSAAKRLWDNVVKKRMYITGGIGSTVFGEAFTFDYDLPNDTMYCETCASIGLLFFARAMLKNDIDSEYAEIMEKTLYNNIIAGMALDGQHFFYVNPLAVDPESCKKDPGKSHVKSTRPSWFGCACCPPNIARTITSLHDYIVSVKENQLFVHLYLDMEGVYKLNNQKVKLIQKSNVPYEGEVEFDVSQINENLKLNLRVPKWSSNITVSINSEIVNVPIEDGYINLEIESDSTIKLIFDIPVIEWSAHPLVKENKGKVAIQRGPFVYCIEEEDNGSNLELYDITETPIPRTVKDNVLGKYILLEAKAERVKIDEGWEGVLYKENSGKKDIESTTIKFIPYHLWANRSVGEMLVWLDRK